MHLNTLFPVIHDSNAVPHERMYKVVRALLNDRAKGFANNVDSVLQNWAGAVRCVEAQGLSDADLRAVLQLVGMAPPEEPAVASVGSAAAEEAVPSRATETVAAAIDDGCKHLNIVIPSGAKKVRLHLSVEF